MFVTLDWLLFPMPSRRRKNRNSANPIVVDPILDRNPVAVLDLHGFAAPDVERAVCNFVQTWQRRAAGCVVHIVTGKGRRSGNMPVVKPRVRQVLEMRCKASVREWTRDIDDGGFLVLLRG